MEWFPDRREDLRERRRRLRQLDVLLLAEIDFFGCTRLPELTDAVADGPETRNVALSKATIREWWDDAVRRQMLYQVVDGDLTRYALSERGTQRLSDERANDALDHRPLLRALGHLIRFVLPSAAAVTAFVTLAEKQTDILLYGIIIAVAIAGSLLSTAAVIRAARPLWRKLVRTTIGNNVDWLEGREMKLRLLGRTLGSLPQREPRRLLPPGEPAGGDETNEHSGP